MKKFQINKLLVLLFTLADCIIKAQQIPYIPVDNYFPQNPQTISYPFGITAPTSSAVPDNVAGSVQVNFIAGQRVQLHDGFHAGGFTGSGYFRAQIGAAADFDVAFMEPNQNTPDVGQFEKLEMGVQLPVSLEQQVNAFLANGTGGLNPFDPDQVSVEAVFSYFNLSYTVYGFYYDEFIRDPNAMTPFDTAEWVHQPTNYHWRIRFAPPLLGPWHCTISIRLNNSTNVSYAVNNLVFNCVGSSNPGWLKKGNDDWHLAYSGSNQSFFAIGQNIAWNGAVFRGGYYDPNYLPLHGDGFLDELDFISDLSDNGGNMVRDCSQDETFELEYHRISNYSDRLDRAWELDRLFELCEQKGMMISFSMADRRFAGGTGGFSWAENPYHTEIPSVNYPDDFLTNSQAVQTFTKKLRYFMSRWGYSYSLGILSIIGEIDGGPYHDLSTIDTKLRDWHSLMFGVAKALVPYRTLLTTTSYGNNANPHNGNAVTPFGLGNCDITTVHSYHSERRTNIMRWDELNNTFPFAKGTLAIWDEQPTYVEEMGIADIGADPNDIEGCSDISMHNSLWATSFMGGFGTGFPWWQWHRNDYRHDNYPALNAFFSNVDFQNIEFKDPDFWDDNTGDRHSASTLEVFYIRTTDGNDNEVMGWVHNSTYWWGNLDENCLDRDDNPMPLPRDDDDFSFPSTPLVQQFELSRLNNLASYTLDWYSTRGAGGVDHTVTLQSSILGILRPNWIGGADWAFKAYRPGDNFRLGNNEVPNDTLLCGEDTIQAYGNYELDTLKNFSYFWDFGNGQTSHERNTIVTFSASGSYLVTLIVSDSSGFSDTLQQTIVKSNCGSSSRIRHDQNSNHISIYPNPGSGFVRFNLDSSWENAVGVTIITPQSQVVYFKTFIKGEEDNLNFENFESGLYFIIFNDSKHREVARFINIKN